ncbi:MAG: hypothetical protein AB1656_01430 [Candidatus Omnitrophota bacterium]
MRRALLFCIFLWSLLGAAESIAGLKCDLCGKEIQGRYITYANNSQTLTVCLACDQTKPRCQACNLPNNPQNLTIYKGERLCRSCIAEAKYCSLCGLRIKGHYYSSKEGGEIFCERCYDAYPKCSVCKLPTPPGKLDKDSGACWRCLPKLPHCAACGKAITGEYFKFKFSDGVYCSDCKLHRDKCYICGVPVGDHFWKFPDGRSICDACNRRAIIDVKQITKIMQTAESLARTRLGLNVTQPYELHVEQLNRESSVGALAAKNGGSSDSPLYGEELGLYRLKNGKSDIYLLYGLPEEMLYETAAHEFAHAWQAENCPLDQSKELKEGFAQWCAAETLRMKGYKEALEKLESRRDSPYGTGYQRVKMLYARMGRLKLLEYLKTARE